MKRTTAFRTVTVLAMGLVVFGLHTSEWTGFDTPAGCRRIKTMLELAASLKDLARKDYLAGVTSVARLPR